MHRIYAVVITSFILTNLFENLFFKFLWAVYEYDAFFVGGAYYWQHRYANDTTCLRH